MEKPKNGQNGEILVEKCEKSVLVGLFSAQILKKPGQIPGKKSSFFSDFRNFAKSFLVHFPLQGAPGGDFSKILKMAKMVKFWSKSAKKVFWWVYLVFKSGKNLVKIRKKYLHFFLIFEILLSLFWCISPTEPVRGRLLPSFAVFCRLFAVFTHLLTSF